MDGCMYGWIGRWMDGWVDWHMDGCMYGWIGIWMDGMDRDGVVG